VERRLAAILCADAVGYSRVMAEDEEGTARTLAACRHLISDLVGQRGGRVVDAPGDNVLAEFPSVVNAVRCAVGIQEELERRMAELPEARRLLFRIGVHLGDVLVEGDRILGDGVNVAARLESLAEPGGICISGTAFDQVEGKLDLTFENTGEQAVKNIPKPVRTYRIGMRPTARGPWALRARRGVPRRVHRTRLAVLVGLVLLALWFLASPPSFLDPGLSRRSDDEKSIAVLPFANMSGDAANEPFTIGIHDDLLSHLSRIGSLKTISRTSVLQYPDWRRSSKAACSGRAIGCESTCSSSTRRRTSTSGLVRTSGSSPQPTSSQSRARSPRPSPRRCR
jgi:adenylate cyclase